jgi:hypothetical protein
MSLAQLALPPAIFSRRNLGLDYYSKACFGMDDYHCYS